MASLQLLEQKEHHIDVSTSNWCFTQGLRKFSIVIYMICGFSLPVTYMVLALSMLYIFVKL